MSEVFDGNFLIWEALLRYRHIMSVFCFFFNFQLRFFFKKVYNVISGSLGCSLLLKKVYTLNSLPYGKWEPTNLFLRLYTPSSQLAP